MSVAGAAWPAWPGLRGFEGPDHRARRAALASASDEALTAHLVSLALGVRSVGPDALEALASAAGLPLGEVVASPFAVRMVTMAVEHGAFTVLGDLRHVLSWPDALQGEEGTSDPDHGVWDRGVMHRGKYQQFLQDEPCATFHPEHVSKWGPHELMHRACGFFLRPGMSRWEHYLGARLNEVLPVVTWYGFEQAMRLDEGAFDRAASGRKPEAPRSEARWLDEDASALEARARAAVPRLREGLAHLERELAAIDEEMATGRRVVLPHPVLDASGDALAYVAGHHARLLAAAPALAALVPRSAGRFEEVGAYRHAIEAKADALLFAPITFDAEMASVRRDARRLWDLAQRGLQLGGRAARGVAALCPELGAELEAAFERGAPVAVEPWRARLLRACGTESKTVGATGGAGEGEPSLVQLAEGLASCAPVSAKARGAGAPSRLAGFAASPSMLRRARLGARWAAFLAVEGTEEHAELARFEAALADAGAGDDRVERLSERDALPAKLAGVQIVASAVFRDVRFTLDVAALHAGGRGKAGPHDLLIGAHLGEVAVVPAPAHVRTALAWLAEGPRPALDVVARLEAASVEPGWPADGRAWLEELVEAGVVGWFSMLETGSADLSRSRTLA